jgi:hypothetical protein
MATRSRIYETTDWQIWTYVPEDGGFTLGFDKLGEAALGSTGGSMTPSNSELTDLEISEGGSISSGILSDIVPASMSASLLVKDFDLSESKKYIVGTPIWVTLKNEETIVERVYGTNTPVFIGRISNFTADLSSNSDFTPITISADSKTNDMLNLNLGVSKNTTDTKMYLLQNEAYLQYPPVFVDTFGDVYFDVDFRRAWTGYDNYNFANTDTERRSIGSWLDDWNNCEQLVAFDNVRYFRLLAGDWMDYSVGPEYTYPVISPSQIKYSYTDDEINEASLSWSGAGAPTGVDLTLTADSEISYQYGTTPENSSFNGFLHSATLDVKDVSQLETIGRQMLSMFPEYAPQSISVQIARTGQEITFQDEGSWYQNINNRYLKPQNLVYCGDKIEVTLDKFGITEKPMIVTGRNIKVSPDTFDVTYELWKGWTV